LGARLWTDMGKGSLESAVELMCLRVHHTLLNGEPPHQHLEGTWPSGYGGNLPTERCMQNVIF
jgi:hypothetical protein